MTHKAAIFVALGTLAGCIGPPTPAPDPITITIFAVGIGLSMPILWAALGELVAEQAGVINVGIEGVMLISACAAAISALRATTIIRRPGMPARH